MPIPKATGTNSRPEPASARTQFRKVSMQVVWLVLGPEGVGRDRQPRHRLVCRRLDLTDLFHV
jgi:hypothetical protein